MAERFDWFPLFVDTFLNSRRVRAMTNEQVGMFIKLLCWQWKDGAFESQEVMRSLCDGNAAAMPGVMRCFEEMESGLVNPDLEAVRADQEEKAAKVSAAGRAGANARWRKRKRRDATA